MSEEITAFHEAGHVYGAMCVGAKVRSVTIDPDNDDGPNRSGDTVVIWDRRRFSRQDLMEKGAWVALAGPVADNLLAHETLDQEMLEEIVEPWIMDS